MGQVSPNLPPTIVNQTNSLRQILVISNNYIFTTFSLLCRPWATTFSKELQHPIII